MTIQEKLDSLQPYVVGIRYIKGVPIIEVILKRDWSIPEINNVTITRAENEDNYYYFFSEDNSITIDKLLEYVETVIKVNIEKEEKYALLKAKVEEMKVLFEDNSLEKLKTMEFSFKDKSTDDLLGNLSKTKTKDKAPTSKSGTNKKTSKSKQVNEQTKDEGDKPKESSQSPKTTPNKEKNGKKKIELETHGLKPEEKEGECNCGPDEACPKCIDNK